MRWITISIFTEKGDQVFILERIKHLLGVLPQCNAFRVKLNYVYGCNIRLALLVSEDQCQDVARRVDSYFKSHLEGIAVKRQSLSLPAQSVFCDYAQNSMQYGLYTVDEVYEREMQSANQLLSNIILEAINDNAEDDSILTLAIYLHLALIKKSVETIGVVQSKKYFFHYYSGRKINGTDAVVDSFFNENKQFIRLIVKDVWMFNGDESDERLWLEKWQEVYRQQLHTNGLDMSYNTFTKAITDFLGFPSEMEQFFYKIMCKTARLKSLWPQ